MHVLNFIEDVDLHVMPKVHEVLNGKPGDEILIGDLHANSLKFFYFLIRHGAISGLDDGEYEELVAICTKRGEALTKCDLEYLRLLLRGLDYNPDVVVNLGGDNVFDKYKSPDFIIMLIVQALIDHGVAVKNYISNHDVELAELSELGLVGDDLVAPRLSAKDYLSFKETAVLLRNGLITKQELLDLYNRYYKTTFRAVGRFVDKSGKVPRIFIVSHAAIDKDTLRKEADYLDPDEKGHKVTFFTQLEKTLDAIDRKFRLVVNGNWIRDLYNPTVMKAAYERRCDLTAHPFECSMWNREYASLDREMVQEDYDIYYIHGHDDWDPGAPNCCNLNNNIGKTSDDSKGQYSIVYVTNHDLPPSVVDDYQFYTGKVVTVVRQAELEIRKMQQSFDEEELESGEEEENETSEPLSKSVVTLGPRGRLFSHAPVTESSISNDEDEIGSVLYPDNASFVFFRAVRGSSAEQQQCVEDRFQL